MSTLHISAPGGKTRCGLLLNKDIKTIPGYMSSITSRRICEECRQEENVVFSKYWPEVRRHLKIE